MDDIDKEIEEWERKVIRYEVEAEQLDSSRPYGRLITLLRKWIAESYLENLKLVKKGKFKVKINLEIEFEGFGSKKIPITEFEVKDNDALKRKMKEVMEFSKKFK